MKTSDYILVGLFWIIWNIKINNCFIITSITKLDILAKSEREMNDAFQKFIRDSDTEEENNLGIFGRYKEKLKEQDLRTIEKGFMENPVNAFQFIWRMHMVWGDIFSNLRCENCIEDKALLEFRNRMQKINGGPKYAVSDDDLHFAALAIVRLWQTYKLDLSSLLRGTILDETRLPFTVEQAFYISYQLELGDYFYKAINWMHGLHEVMIKNPNAYSEAELTRAAIKLASLYSKAGKPWISVAILEREMADKNDQNLKKLKRDIGYFSEKAKDTPVSKRNDTLSPDERDLTSSHYEALCRGDIPRGKKIMSRLRCIHRPTKLPYYRVKEEILNFNPRLSIFHDIISEEDMKLVKEIAKHKLQDSIIFARETDGGRDAKTRVSQTAWFRNEDGDIYADIAKKVGLVTGLDTKSSIPLVAEDLQVLNYGIGGMYTPHVDFFGFPLHSHSVIPNSIPRMERSGDREATWMFYLSDVKAGGATVFTDMKITVPPIKGAAAFWYDIKRNGDLDWRTRHAGCPVLLGSKWVANKWILQGGQMLRRPCGLRPNAIDTPIHS